MHPLNIYSGIVVIGVLIIALAIYIFTLIAWHIYPHHGLSFGEGNGDQQEAKKEKYFPSMRWKPFLNTFNIPKIENGNGNHADDDDDVEQNSSRNECVVCLRVFEDGELVRQFPQCHHTFHADCIDKWLYSHSECCPLCRSPINLPLSSGCGGEMAPGNNSIEVSVDIGTSARAIATS